MVTITLMGQLQTADGERELACEIAEPITVRQLIQQQGAVLEEVLQLMREKKLMVTVNKRIASEDTRVQDGDTIKLVAHDGMGGSGLAPTL
jgi:sulfur-carrier protein